MTRVLVARLDSLGDVLVSGPAVRAIAARPDVDEVWMLASPQGAAAARLLPCVTRVLVWSCPWITSPTPPVSRESIAELSGLIRFAAPDEAVILTSFHQSPLPLALLLRLAGVPVISGASVDFAGTLLDVRLKPGEDFDEDQPEPLRALAIAAAAGFPLPAEDDGSLRVTLPAGAPDAAAELLADLDGEPYVVLHPGAAVPARQWPVGQHRAAALLLLERGVNVVVTGAPNERALTAEVVSEHPAPDNGARLLDLGGRSDLPTLAAVLAGAAVVVVGNTGPAHLAAAVGVPIVSLFSPVVPAVRWAPFGVPVRLLGDQAAACRSTRARECPVAGHPCLSSVTPENVVDACFELAPLLGRQSRAEALR